MEILFLTISDQQNHPLHQYIDLHRTYDFKPWEAGFRAISTSIRIFDYYSTFVSRGPIFTESRILDLVSEHNIELIIVPNLYYELAPTFFDKLRHIGCRSMVIFFDDSMRFENTNRFYLSSFDYYLTHESVDSKRLYKPFGIKPAFFPVFPCYSFYDEVIPNLEKDTSRCLKDIVFVGAKIADRSLFVDYLVDNGIEVGAFGSGWAAGMIPTQDMLNAFNSSKISLSFIKTVDGSGRFQLKARLFEIVMAGGFILSEYCDELNDYFDIGYEIDTFKSPQDLLEKVRFYLENDDLRLEMAARAREKTVKNYSFESNWSGYLTDIKTGRIKSEYPNTGYEVSAAAIKSFKAWAFPIIYGRCMLGEFKLAYQQYYFCRRELKFIVGNEPLGRDFVRWLVHRLAVRTANRLSSQGRVRKLRQWYSRFRA